VRQIAGMGGDVSAFVPEPVLRRLKAKFADNATVGAANPKF
jgi:phosphopantetheine adenylyltransferase